MILRLLTFRICCNLMEEFNCHDSILSTHFELKQTNMHLIIYLNDSNEVYKTSERNTGLYDNDCTDASICKCLRQSNVVLGHTSNFDVCITWFHKIWSAYLYVQLLHK